MTRDLSRPFRSHRIITRTLGVPPVSPGVPAPPPQVKPQPTYLGKPTYGRMITKQEIAALIGPKVNPVILEIGCNSGEDTKEFLDTFPGCKIYCFEPDPRPIVRFCARIGNEPRCELFKTAVGAYDGIAVFHQSSGKPRNSHLDDWDLSGSIAEPVLHKQMSPEILFEKTIEVQVIRLDSWAIGRLGVTEIDWIWMDVQSAEYDVIVGGSTTLKQTRYLFGEYYLTEIYRGQKNLEQILELLGQDWELLGTWDSNNFLAKNKRLVP